MRRSTLANALRGIGVREGEVLFVHARGGADTVVNALLDAVGPRGTVAAVASWSDIPLRMDEWDPARRLAYLEEMPGFDPDHSGANPLYGRLPERLRSWPGSRKGAHPDQRVIAVGAHAEWPTDPHPLDDSFGPNTPFARLAWSTGRFRTRTSAPAEATRAKGSRRSRAAPSTRAFGRCGRVGRAHSHLFPAAPLVRFAVSWLEERFSAPPQERQPQHPRRGQGKAEHRE